MDLSDPVDLGNLAARTGGDPDGILDVFLEVVAQRGITLYPAQEEAIVEIVADAHVIVNTPTGSGKSLIAQAGHFAALSQGRRSFYTAPVKALVSEKFFALAEAFGRDRVGMMTGDASVNRDAPIICCTAEILANLALREGADAGVDQVVMDEFHYFGDPDRGWAWQVPLLTLTDTQFVLLSATLGDVTRFETDLPERTGRSVAVVRSATRPVPLVHDFRVATLTDTLSELVETGGTPAYVVFFTQAAAVDQAQAAMSLRLCTREEKDAIAAEIGSFRFGAGFGRSLSRFVRNGIGVHHAGMLPRYRRLVERLAQKGLLKVICGTDTLGVGIDVPIRTVVLTALSKYDGTSSRLLTAREFHQIGGRAGRAGHDTLGTVIGLAPEHAIENARLVAKAGGDAKKLRKLVKKKPPPGMVSWGEPTFRRLVEAPPEPLVSHLTVSHAMVLQMLDRPGDGRGALHQMLESSYESPASIARLTERATQIETALVEAEVLEELETPDEWGRTIRVVASLQDEFALNQPLALFAVAALDLLDPEAPEHALDMVSVMEAVLEDPRPVVASQLRKARDEAMSRMKAEGLDYEQRMTELDTITAPRPLADLLEPMFATYTAARPWAAEHHLAPKSVVREMYERAMDFGDYVRFHGLARSEGVVLRYLSDAYRTLRRTVPEAHRTEVFDDLVAWLGAMVRQVDSSLVDEWERLDDEPDPLSVAGSDREPPRLTTQRRAFTVLVRNALFRRVELVARRRWEDLGDLDDTGVWNAQRWKDTFVDYFAEYDTVQTGADARNPAMLTITEAPDAWTVRQTIDDPAGDRSWALVARIDLDASDAEGVAVVSMLEVTRD